MSASKTIWPKAWYLSVWDEKTERGYFTMACLAERNEGDAGECFKELDAKNEGQLPIGIWRISAHEVRIVMGRADGLVRLPAWATDPLLRAMYLAQWEAEGKPVTLERV